MRFKQWLESLELNYLRNHLSNPSLDLASHIWDFINWRGSDKLCRRLGIDKKEFEQGIEDGDDRFYEVAERISKAMSQAEVQDFLAHMNRTNPGDVPSHSLMNLQKNKGRKGYLPPTTWLIHFSDDAEDVANDGFTKGQGDMNKLALTLHQGKAEKEYGGYNFAFEAGSRYAVAAAREGRYGKDAVMFQASGIPIYHDSDEEDQVVLWGQDVPVNRMVLLLSDGDEWVVRARNGKRDDVFKGDFRKCVAWVVNNYNQYRRIL